MRTATAQILAQEGIQQGRGGGGGPPTGPPTNLLAAMRCSNNSEQLGRVSEAASTNGTTAAGRPPLPPDRPRLQTLLVSAAVPPAAPPLCSSNCVALALRSRPPLARVTSVAPRSVGALFFCGPNLCSVDLASCCRPHASLRRCVAAAARRVRTPPAPLAQRCPPSRRPRHLALAVPFPTCAGVKIRGWDTNDVLPCGKVRPTCGASAGRRNAHTLTWFCGGSCRLQFGSRPTEYQHMES